MIFAPQLELSALSSPTNTGHGQNGDVLIDMLTDTINHLRKTGTDDQRLQTAISALNDLYQECCESNWDGYGAAQLTRETFSDAYRFLMAVPSHIPMPEFVPEPNGGIALEWFRNSQLVLVISLRGEGSIIYAGIFGVNKVHGTEYFEDSIPDQIMFNLNRLYPQISH